ncbi:hypothetical protein Agabi119p4_6229 [Agaricus bisporus var. burnettii]|nr:hypothetical protein Agabi119p4_6229 [Agaricus bisporus var. burnettii]
MGFEENVRAVTPTPSCASGRSRSGSGTSTIQQDQMPRLRKRRSSINIGTSPMNVIKSPQRNAENALQFQRSIGRSRTGSLSFLGLGSTSPSGSASDSPNVASQTSRLIIRMRSGSVGGAAIHNMFRSRRSAARRLACAPAMPPPTAPLPALPAEPVKQAKSGSLFQNTSIFSNPKAVFSQVIGSRQPLAKRTSTGPEPAVNTSTPRGRDRAYSCTKGVAVDTPIDEMKEN